MSLVSILKLSKPDERQKKKIENALGIRMDKMVYNKDLYENFKSEFYNKGCVTMKDWLKIYNLIDVIPFIEALEKTRNNYVKDGIDMLKDSVSIPEYR